MERPHPINKDGTGRRGRRVGSTSETEKPNQPWILDLSKFQREQRRRFSPLANVSLKLLTAVKVMSLTFSQKERERKKSLDINFLCPAHPTQTAGLSTIFFRLLLRERETAILSLFPLEKKRGKISREWRDRNKAPKAFWVLCLSFCPRRPLTLIHGERGQKRGQTDGRTRKILCTPLLLHRQNDLHTHNKLELTLPGSSIYETECKKMREKWQKKCTS